jgi:drug/metabolite transporter (DMT)-like permease
MVEGNPVPVGGRRLAVLALLATMIVWGSSFVVTQAGLAEAGPFTVTALRFGLGLLVLLPFAHRRGFRFRLVLRPAFLLFGLTGVALVYGLQTLALVFITAANTALISAGEPVAAAVLARAFLKEPVPPGRLISILVSVVGVVLVSGTTPSGASSGTVLFGNALMVGAVIAYGAYAVHGPEGGRAPPGGRGHGGELRGRAPLPPPSRRGRGPPPQRAGAGATGGLAVVYLEVAASALTMFLWNYALGHLATGAAALYINLVPVVGLGTALLFGERVGAVQLIGGALAVAGVLLGDATSSKWGGGTG